jgi:hypothetical protein
LRHLEGFAPLPEHEKLHASMKALASLTYLALGVLAPLACVVPSQDDEQVTEHADRFTKHTGADEERTKEPPDATSDGGVSSNVDVPPTLIAALGRDRTYVEESCASTTYPDWPHPAQRCTYHGNLVVTIANPTQERVARWIVDASTLIPALDGLRNRDRASWEKGLVVIAKHTIAQSSRIFPLEGQVWENGTAYVFERGVTKTCSTGCYCRVNSTSRQDWCAYAANVLGTEDETECLSKYGQPTSTLTEAWLRHCFENHKTAWDHDTNDHYRAKAWRANATIAARFPNPSSANGAAVVSALDEIF